MSKQVEVALTQLAALFPTRRVKVERILLEHAATDMEFHRGEDWRLMLFVPHEGSSDYGATGSYLSFTGASFHEAIKKARAYVDPLKR